MEGVTLSQFLKDNNAHAKFVFNSLASECDTTINGRTSIALYFAWRDTKEGVGFWYSLDAKVPANLIDDMTYLKDIQLTKRKNNETKNNE